MAMKNETHNMKTMMVSDGKVPDYAAMRDSIELRNGIYFMCVTVLFFQVVNWVLKSHGPPKSLVADEWLWRNLWVSWFHAGLVSVWTILSMVLYPELFQGPMEHINYFTYFNICFITAYFLYDFIDLLINDQLIKSWELIVHHIAVGTMFYYNVHIRSYIGFNVIALIVEFNSFFLHWRKLLQMVKTPYNCRKYLVIKYLNLTTFTFFRFGGVFIITWSIHAYGHMVSWLYYVGICSSMFFLNILNVILFWRLLKSDVLRGSGGKVSLGNGVSNLKRDFWVIVTGESSDLTYSNGNGYLKVDQTGNNNVPSYQVNGLKED